MDMTYKAEYEDGEMEVFDADNDRKAIEEAEQYEGEHGIIFNIFLLNDDYDEIRTIF